MDALESVIGRAEEREATGYEPTGHDFVAWTEFHAEHVESVPREPLSGCGPDEIPEHPHIAASIVLADNRLWGLVERQQRVDTWFRRAALVATLGT